MACVIEHIFPPSHKTHPSTVAYRTKRGLTTDIDKAYVFTDEQAEAILAGSNTTQLIFGIVTRKIKL
jgi:hypothetical protein